MTVVRKWFPLIVVGVALGLVLAVAMWPKDEGRVNTHGDPGKRTAQEEQYLYNVRAASIELRGRSDAVLLDGGHAFCDQMDRGADAMTLYQGTVDNGGDPDLTYALIWGATSTLCPEHPGLTRK